MFFSYLPSFNGCSFLSLCVCVLTSTCCFHVRIKKAEKICAGRQGQGGRPSTEHQRSTSLRRRMEDDDFSRMSVHPQSQDDDRKWTLHQRHVDTR